MQYSVFGGQGTIQHGFISKREAIDWARDTRKLTDFEIIDENETVVYQEFPESKFI